MPTPASPQLRFLLRASALLVIMLALWWGFLLNPMLDALRLSTNAALHVLPGDAASSGVTLDSNGDWILRVPITESMARQESVQRIYGHTPGTPPVKIRSFKLAIAPRVPTFFTLSFPLFWALMLAGPGIRTIAKSLAFGTALLALLALLSLLFYTAYTIETTLQLVTGGLALTLWGAAEYLNLNVVSYVAPLLTALWLHRKLREQVLSFDPAAVPAAKVPVAVLEERSRRGRYRG